MEALVQKAVEQLGVVQRQAAICNMYGGGERATAGEGRAAILPQEFHPHPHLTPNQIFAGSHGGRCANVTAPRPLPAPSLPPGDTEFNSVMQTVTIAAKP